MIVIIQLGARSRTLNRAALANGLVDLPQLRVDFAAEHPKLRHGVFLIHLNAVQKVFAVIVTFLHRLLQRFQRLLDRCLTVLLRVQGKDQLMSDPFPRLLIEQLHKNVAHRLFESIRISDDVSAIIEILDDTTRSEL